LCNNLKTTFSDINQKLISNEKFGMDIFFKSDNYHILSNEEMEALHSEVELSNTIKISNMIEEYDILSNPRLPPFSCPN
jgi:DNA polymerase III alpha subunit